MADINATAKPFAPAHEDSMTAQELPISAIRVGERVRREMGDIDALARSIDALGLLQPVVITQDCELIAGERRLRACQSLGWTDIPVRVAFIDAIALGERDEIEVRKDFTISERVLIAQAVERSLGNRQGQRTDRGLPQNIAEVKGRESRDIAAERAGFGNRETYRQAKDVVENAASELVDALDAGKVSVSAASIIAKLPVEDQRQIVEAGSHIRMIWPKGFFTDGQRAEIEGLCCGVLPLCT
jgi:ParB family chromosome partitioning protein